MNYYVRATGDNRYANGGTDKWLRIRKIKRYGYGYVFGVKINGQNKLVAVRKDKPTENLEFAMGKWPNLQPVSHKNVIEGMTK
jgi:hypothetical protein